MIKQCWKCLTGIITTALLSFYLFLLYELLMVPAILDWSTFGVILMMALIGLLIWSIPVEKRLSTTVLAVTFLLAVKAMDNIREYPFVKHALAAILIFFVLLIAGKLLGRFTIRRYLVMFLIALLIGTAVDLSEVRFWPEFTVKWESPTLYKKLATVDYFPTILADVDGDNIKEIITQQNPAEAAKEQQERVENGAKNTILEPEKNYFAVYKWDGRTFSELTPDRYSLAKLKAVLPRDYIGYPFYQNSLSLTSKQIIEQQMNPILDRAGLVDETTRFGSFPFKMLAMNRQSLETKLLGERALGLPPSTSAAAVGNLIPGPPSETVSINNSLLVREADPTGKQVASLDSEQIPDIGTSEVLMADIDADKTDELLLTAANSRILELNRQGRWQTLWASPEAPNEKFRFQGFRFEDFATLGNDKIPQILALSKSNVRENPARYMTGYIYKDGGLVQTWRVFSGLINLKAGDVDGDGQNELTGYMYRQQRIYILEKHHLPVVQVLYIITAGLIVFGFTQQWRRKKSKNSGGEVNV